MAALEQLVGTVSKVNDNGFQVQERPGTWLNPSKFADPMPALPEVGQRVAIGLDQKGFVRTVELAGPRPVDAAPKPTEPTSARPDREVVSSRPTIIKAASHVAAARPDMNRAEMFKLATEMEAWTMRP